MKVQDLIQRNQHQTEPTQLASEQYATHRVPIEAGKLASKKPRFKEFLRSLEVKKETDKTSA
jgi:predicted outer membrane protein